MKERRARPVALLVFALLAVGTLHAHAADPDRSLHTAPRMAFLDHWRAILRTGFMAGSGYATGYTDYFLPLLQNDRGVFFFTPKASFTDDDSNEQNIGLGYRYLNYAESLILGGNVFFDTRRSVYGNRFNQVGAGVEFLTKWIDARVNGYFPTTDEKRIAAQDTYALGRDGLLRYDGFEEPLSGLDYELGILIPGLSNIMETRFYAGGYRYDSRKFDDVTGERLRLEIMPTRFMTLEMKADIGHDGHTHCSYGGFVTLPFDIGNIFRLKNPFEGWGEMVGFGRGPRELTERMTDRVVRDLDIVRKVGPEVNPRLEQGLIYVDNTNTSGIEDGTLDHPYNTLAEALTAPGYGTGSWVYVDRGDGTAAGYTGNYTLADSVVLWGSGYDGGYPGIAAPGFPMIDGGGAASPVITLGNGNTVMGVSIQHGSDGVYILNRNNARIRHNDISNNSSDGIYVFNNGAAAYSGHEVTANTFTANGGNAVFVYNSSSGAIDDLDFTDNTMTGNLADGFFIVNQTTGTMTGFTFTGNTITQSSQYGICTYNVAGGTMTGFTFTDNVVNDNTWYGINVNNEAAGTFSNFTFTGNTISSNDMDGIDLYNETNGTFTDFVFTRNTITFNTWDGVYLRRATGAMSGINFGDGASGGYNSIYGNEGYYDDGMGLTNLSGIDPLPAQDNWWGEDSEPSGKVFGSVDYTPWLHSAP